MWSDENPSSGYTDAQASFRLDLARREEADEPQQGEQLARRRRGGRSLRETAERYALTPPTANGCAR